MKSLLFKGLAGVAATGTLATGGFLAFKYVGKPTNVRGRLIEEGYVVADVNKDGVWRAIYLARNKDAGFSNFVSGNSKETAGPQLKQKCSELLSASVENEASYEDAKQWCLSPELTSIEMQFDFEDREFASGDDDFKNLFTLNRENPDFINAVKSKVSSFAKETVLDTAKSNVESWCGDLKAKSPSGSDLRNAREWCTKPISNLNAFMDEKGFRPVSSDGWSGQFTSLKSQDSGSILSSDIGSSGDSDGGTKLREWCENKKLSEAQIHSLNGDFEKAKVRCFVKK